jgi:hypothetical protein
MAMGAGWWVSAAQANHDGMMTARGDMTSEAHTRRD